MSRVFLIVLDSLGVGALPDAHLYGDEGSNTLASCSKSILFSAENLKNLGLFNIEGINCGEMPHEPIGCFGKMAERSNGKDTTIGHWEIAGVVSGKPFQTFPKGFPQEFIEKFEDTANVKTLCNLPYSGTEVIKDYGKEHQKSGKLIVYTSADSVFQIAAHEDVVPVKKLYEYCEIARKLLNDEYNVGRVIARPFIGEYPNYVRTANRHDYSVEPPRKTLLDKLKEEKFDVIGIGKIYDIFAGRGLTESYKTKSNADGMNKLTDVSERDFNGLCFINLVDFDSAFGHRNDVDGYANAIAEFDAFLGRFIKKLRDDDVLIITADHGCDPATPSTDHSREYVPLLVYGRNFKEGVNLGVRTSFADISATVAKIFDLKDCFCGTEFLSKIKR